MGTDQHRHNGLWLCSREVRSFPQTTQTTLWKKTGLAEGSLPASPPGYSPVLGILLVGLVAVSGIRSVTGVSNNYQNMNFETVAGYSKDNKSAFNL